MLDGVIMSILISLALATWEQQVEDWVVSFHFAQFWLLNYQLVVLFLYLVLWTASGLWPQASFQVV